MNACLSGFSYQAKRTLALVWLAGTAGRGFAATIIHIHEKKHKVIVSLESEEMATLQLKTEIALELKTSGGSFFIFGTPHNLNPLRKTVVIDLALDEDPEPEDDLRKLIKVKQKLIFQPKMRNMRESPPITTPSQHYQYQYPMIESQGGGIYDQLTSTLVDRVITTKAVATQFGVHALLPAIPGKLNFGLGLLATDASIKKANAPSDANLAIVNSKDRFETTKLLPSAMWVINESYVLGFEYDWHSVKSTQSDSIQSLIYNFTFAEPVVSVTMKSSSSEKTLRYKGSDRSDGTLSNRNFTATNIENQRVALPATLHLTYRRFWDVRWKWSQSVGYVFYKGEAANTAKPKTPEQLFSTTVFEQRCDNGDQIDYILDYRGSKAPGLTRFEQGTNTIKTGLQMTRPLGDLWQAGARFAVEAGTLTQEETKDQFKSLGTIVSIHIQKEFWVDSRRRTSRM